MTVYTNAYRALPVTAGLTEIIMKNPDRPKLQMQ
jgi:hypothetical protein